MTAEQYNLMFCRPGVYHAWSAWRPWLADTDYDIRNCTTCMMHHAVKVRVTLITALTSSTEIIIKGQENEG